MNQPNVDFVIDSIDEPVQFSRSRHREDIDMDITPMIDITFLLLIFFLVATRISSQGVVDLPTARHGTAVSAKNAVVLTVAKGNGQEASIYKGDGISSDTQLTGANLEQQQDEMEKFINEAIGQGKQHVLVKAEGGVKHRDVARVARAAGDASVSVLYVAVLEAR